MTNFWCLLCLCVWCFMSVVEKAESVDTLLSIASDLGYSGWKGSEPCQHHWYGVDCIGGRIIGIMLVAENLTGVISPRFADIRSLRVIDLSHNRLRGTIPSELTRLNLASLDLSYNQLHGKVPPFKATVVQLVGNPGIETKTRGNHRGLIIGIIVLSVLLIGVACLAVYREMRERRSKSDAPEPMTTLDKVVEVENIAFPFEILREATEDFGNHKVLGRGGFGTVYKGRLPDGKEIAVKRMKPSVAAGKGLDEFRAEVSVLTKVHHCNLVTFHGYCVQGNERHLVYQYMPQGSLARHLFQWKEEGLRPLEWSRRLTIALDVARGVEYLHTLSRPSQSYIHRDLKPENILLGDDMRARVSDFGLVRSTEEGISSIKTKFCGTFGYMPPEYALTGRVTKKLDVYSFGIILMELISGQRAIDDTRSEENTHILVWFRNRSLSSVIDETIQVSKETQHLQSISEVAQLALYCCANEPEQRPEMSHVVTTLSLRAEQWKPISEPEIKDQIQEESLLEQLRRWKQESEGGSSTDITG